MTNNNTGQSKVGENIRHLYYGRYLKDSFNNASRTEKLFYHLAKNPLVKYGVYGAIVLPAVYGLNFNFLPALALGLAQLSVQRHFANKYGVTPIENTAMREYRKDLFKGTLFKLYEQDIQKEDFNEKANPKNPIYSATHETIRLNAYIKEIQEIKNLSKKIDRRVKKYQSNKSQKPSQQM